MTDFRKWFLSFLILFVVCACLAQVAQPPPSSEVYGISALYLYPTHQTPADFEKATGGQVAPPFQPAYRPKHWFDPAVDVSDPEADTCYSVAKVTKDGPRVVQACMPAFEAAAVNIPTGEAASGLYDPRARPAREVPIRPLLANEALVNTPFGLQIVNLDRRAARLKTEGAFLPADRTLLEAIARKLGVTP
jgi:hypothetical protein